MNKAIFLDRDGTINVEKGYLYRIEDFEFIPGVINALRVLQDAGFKLIIITNQSGIARGYYSIHDYKKLNAWMLNELRKNGIIITAVYYCPHHPNASIPEYKMDCFCRKPKLGMFEKAVKEYNLDLNQCFTIGDKIRDCSICSVSHCHGFLVAENETPDIIRRVKAGKYRNVEYKKDLKEAVERIITTMR